MDFYIFYLSMFMIYKHFEPRDGGDFEMDPVDSTGGTNPPSHTESDAT